MSRNGHEHAVCLPVAAQSEGKFAKQALEVFATASGQEVNATARSMSVPIVSSNDQDDKVRPHNFRGPKRLTIAEQ